MLTVMPSRDARIVHVHFDTQYELASSFVRLQEFYESPFPEIKGKRFSLDTFMDVYTAASESKEFTYFTDWAGFNVPGDVVLRFMELYSKRAEQRDKEWEVFYTANAFTDVDDAGFYIIGTYGKATAVAHEIAHAYYYLEPSYREACEAIYKTIPDAVQHAMRSKLEELGYDAAVMEDEFQAYFSTDSVSELRDRFFEHHAHTAPRVWRDVLRIRRAYREALGEIWEKVHQNEEASV